MVRGRYFWYTLAIEGMMAFFMESTFIAVMFFGWNKVSKRFHLMSTYLVAIGANLSALWILVANGWMQYPVGMQFNPDTARNEMINFWEILLSPVAVSKFLHTIGSGFVLASFFVVSVSAWFILKKREIVFAKKSILIASIFGILSTIFVILTGDTSTRVIAHKQPMKFAAFEGLYDGMGGAPLVAIGVLSDRTDTSRNYLRDFTIKIEIPNLLSYMTYLDPNAFVPGINDLIHGNDKYDIMPAREKIERGRVARERLKEFQVAKKNGDGVNYERLKKEFEDPEFLDNYFRYFGYGFLNDENDLVPNVPLSFYSFHLMVALGFYFVLFFVIVLRSLFRDDIHRRKMLLRIALFSLPLPYLATIAGWLVAEMGRQPWTIQDYLPTIAATSQLNASAVQLTFWIFAFVFTALLIAEVAIMTKQIKIGPK